MAGLLPNSPDSRRWSFTSAVAGVAVGQQIAIESYGKTELTEENSMFMTLFAVLVVLWLLGFFAFHAAGGLIHVLLILAVISLVVHFFRGRSVA